MSVLKKSGRNTTPEALGDRSDVELINLFQAGDEDAFAELYARRQAEIFTFCLRMSGNDRDLASDAFQDTFIKVYQKADQFREGTNVMGWLLMIARNSCLNLLRGRKLIPLEDQHHNIASGDRTLSPDFHEEQDFMRRMLEKFIGELPLEIREPLILREFEEYSYEDIAKTLNITLGAVKQRIYRAKQKLREDLLPYFREEEVLDTSIWKDGKGPVLPGKLAT